MFIWPPPVVEFAIVVAAAVAMEVIEGVIVIMLDIVEEAVVVDIDMPSIESIM